MNRNTYQNLSKLLASVPGEELVKTLRKMTGERIHAVKLMREGVGIMDVGRETGLGRKQAAKHLRKDAIAALRAAASEEAGALETVTYNALLCAGFMRREDIEAGVRCGAITPETIPHYGAARHKEVCDWLEASRTVEGSATKPQTIKQEPEGAAREFDFDGLRTLMCGIRKVAVIDDHDVIRRDSVLEILERFRPKKKGGRAELTLATDN